MAPTGSSPPLPGLPPRNRRRLSNALIVAIVAAQVAAPLHYYLSGGGSDERFSWRMFSARRVERCEFRLLEVPSQGRATALGARDLRSQLHVGWIQLLNRGRPAVVDGWLERRCADSALLEVRYQRRCTAADAAPRPIMTRALRCADRAEREERRR